MDDQFFNPKRRLCIVDDQEIVRDTLKVIVTESENIQLIGDFSSAELFLEAYDQLLPDITIMDLDLPGMSGIEAIITVKLNYPESKFLILTNFNDDDRLFNALTAGADGYLLKRKSFENILSAIESVYNGGAPMTPEIAKKVILHFQRYGQQNITRFQQLTEKETAVLRLLADGLLYKEIADRLSVGIDAIKKTTQRIYEKLQVHTRSEAIKKYLTTY